MIHAIVRGSSAEVGRGMSRSLPSTRTFTDGGANYNKNKSWSERHRQQSQAKLFYAYGGNYFQVDVKLTFELSKVLGLNRCFTSRID